MNTQLNKTLKAISPEIPKFIRQLEKTHNQQATITIEKIDRPLILTRGEIEEQTDFMYSNPKGLLKEIYSSCYYALYGSSYPIQDKLTLIPLDAKTDFKQTAWGLDIVEFLSYRDSTKLKAIIHVDIHKSLDYEPLTVQVHWFKIQIATPKENNPPIELVKAEIEKRIKLATIRELRKDLRVS